MKLPPEPGMSRDMWLGQDADAPFPLQPRFILVSGVVVHGPAGFAPHPHPHYEVVCVASGRYDCRVDGARVRLDAGDVLVIRPGETHEEELIPPILYAVVHFSLGVRGRATSSDIFERDVTVAQRCLRGARGCIQATIDRLAVESALGDGLGGLAQDALVATLFIDLLRVIPPHLLRREYRPGERAGGFAQRLKQIFARHEHERLDVPSMAARMAMSERSLMHRCRREMGTSPAHAFTAFKMARAVHLLRETSMPVQAIAERLGFSDPFHFSKAFKRIHGKAPSAVRRV